MKPDGIELALLHALRYEESTFKSYQNNVGILMNKKQSGS